LGGGNIVPLHRASLVVIPELGLRVCTSPEHRAIVNELDGSQAVIAFDWVTNCVEQDTLFDLSEYKLQSPSKLAFGEGNQQAFKHQLGSIAGSTKSSDSVVSTVEVQSPSHKSGSGGSPQHGGTPKSVDKLLSEAQHTGQITPTTTSSVTSLAKSLDNLACQAEILDKTVALAEVIEVPEHLMGAFFWLEDKLNHWGRSDFGGSLVGFFTRVRMQVSLYSQGSIS